tara:strand:- start:3251 stop:4246 length:996 start_codon:yes stop_codon:yes gene_type:complete
LTEKHKANVADYKKRIVKELVDLINNHPIVGAINLENLPAPQLQKMREKLRSSVIIKVTKRRLMKLAIDQTKDKKKGIEKIIPHLKGMPGLLFTKENPFKLAKIIRKNKSPAPAKAGQIAPKDIIIKAGVTPFAPGPVISELGAIGLKSGVENGKVAIKEDKVVTKEGEVIKANVASMLTRLSIFPMEVGLDLVAVFEDGTIFARSVLDIDDKQFMENMALAGTESFNLAIDIGYMTKDTVEVLLPKAHNEALALARSQDILCSETVGEVLSKAEAQMNALKSEVGELKVEVKEEVKKEETKKEETKKVEEKKEESKTEEKKENKVDDKKE